MAERSLVRFLKVDLPIFIESSEKGFEFKFQTKILGWRKGSFVAIKTPIHRGFRVSIPQDTGLSVRFFSEGSLIVFRSTVSCYAPAPVFVTFLSYPDSFDEIKIRKYDRIQVYIPAEVFKNGDKTEGTLLDLSMGGALLVSRDKYEKGEKLRLGFFLPNGFKLSRVLGEVRSVRESDSGFFMHGLKFVRMSSEEEKGMSRFFESVKKSGREGAIWVSQPS